MLTSFEINKKIKAGATVTAHPEGYSGQHQVLMTRVGLADILQVKIKAEGRTLWRNAAWSSVRVEERKDS